MVGDLLTGEQLPDWFQYPREFQAIIDRNLVDLAPWSILFGDQLRERSAGLKQRYLNRSLVPFARRLDNDDVACWERGGGNTVIIIHDFASPGFEDRQRYDSLWDWFRAAVDDMIEYEDGP